MSPEDEDPLSAAGGIFDAILLAVIFCLSVFALITL